MALLGFVVGVRCPIVPAHHKSSALRAATQRGGSTPAQAEDAWLRPALERRDRRERCRARPPEKPETARVARATRAKLAEFISSKLHTTAILTGFGRVFRAYISGFQKHCRG